MSTEPVTIILAEDDDGHASLVERNLQRAGLVNGFVRVKDGEEALNFINGVEPFERRELSDSVILLLDIKMPKVDGMEVLRQLKQNQETASIPVIMLTTTDDPREIEKCYQLGCNVYITKPVEYDQFIEAIRRLGLFLQVVKTPKASMAHERRK